MCYIEPEQIGPHKCPHCPNLTCRDMCIACTVARAEKKRDTRLLDRIIADTKNAVDRMSNAVLTDGVESTMGVGIPLARLGQGDYITEVKP